MTIAFIIIAYKPKMEEFGRLLNLLTEYPVIVVDNGGTLAIDGVGRATLLSQFKNLGYGAAANIGIHHASGLGAKWFVLLNQDMSFTKTAIQTLIRALKNLSPCIAGPFGAGLDARRWTTMLPSDRTDYLTGSCLAIHEKVVSKIGYFYEPYFLYYEDADYCVRAKLAGFPFTKIALDDATHEESASLGRGSLSHQYYLARNHMLFVERLAPASVKLYEFFRSAKTIAEHIMRQEKGALRGLRNYVFRRYGAWEGRGV
ncbi:MAG: glycosyltransferase family 2 protein [Patescibacteria group bacterium]